MTHDPRGALDPVLSFLDELAANAVPGKREALNPILIGGSAKLYAEGLRDALTASAPKGEPAAYAVLTGTSHVRIWWTAAFRDRAEKFARDHNVELTPLYASPPPAAGWDEAILAVLNLVNTERKTCTAHFGIVMAAKLDRKIAALRREAPAPSTRAVEDLTWFWEIVDSEGFEGVPSDERDALSRIMNELRKLRARPDDDAGVGKALSGLRDWIDSFFDRKKLKPPERELMERADAALSTPSDAVNESAAPSGNDYYTIQSALSPHIASSTELMAAMSSIWPLIKSPSAVSRPTYVDVERLADKVALLESRPDAGGGARLLYRPFSEYDDWGVIRSADGKMFATVRCPISKEEADEHRKNKTDPFESLGKALISALSTPSDAVNESAEAPQWPANLHPLTLDLVKRFAVALAEKLCLAEEKYGYSDNWQRDDWKDDCQHKLIKHIAKGDPRDVAAYCAFMWHHGWPTVILGSDELAGCREVLREATVKNAKQAAMIADLNDMVLRYAHRAETNASAEARLREALEKIIEGAPIERPPSNSDCYGYFSDDPDDHRERGYEHARFDMAEIARQATVGDEAKKSNGPDATPAGPVVGETSGATAGETATFSDPPDRRERIADIIRDKVYTEGPTATADAILVALDREGR